MNGLNRRSFCSWLLVTLGLVSRASGSVDKVFRDKKIGKRLTPGIYKVDIDQIREPHYVPYDPDQKVINGLAELYQRHGQCRAMKVDQTGLILTGVHSYRALRLAGMTRALVHVLAPGEYKWRLK